ncbi:MAG: signal recognition particle-docking protein FtsY [Campylobacteraceae bacterium]|nr:signal recognition particle-docking protein FtsY [Campylobacteraceae bacterium]
MFSFFKKKKEVVENIEENNDDSVNQEELDEIYKASEDAENEELQSDSDEKNTQERVNEEQTSPQQDLETKDESEVQVVLEENIESVIEVEESVESETEVSEEEKKGFFSRALAKTFENIRSIVPQKKEKIEFDLIEEILIESDMEYEIIEKAMDGLPKMISRKDLRHRLIMLFEFAPKVNIEDRPTPFIELIIGVNGAGKTTTIAKLANRYKQNGKSVVLGAGDTFRAAAIEQLSAWAQILDVPIIKTKQGHDASAVAYDTISSAISKNIDHVIIDTAGRLQTQTNLSHELKKIVKVCGKAYEGAPHQKLMILDGTQGNSAINQAQAFNDMVGIDGIIVTKLDGTAKGGALFSISNQLELPILYVGVGEKKEDLIEFSPDAFVDSLLDGIYQEEEK